MAAKDYNKFTTDLLQTMLKEQASDLHLSVGRKPVLRVNTELIPLTAHDDLSQSDVEGVLKIFLGPTKYEEFVAKQEIDFAYQVDGGIRLRGNAFVASGTTGIALRAIQKVRTFEELNLPPILKTFAAKKQGFFLVVGPVGQGKSTTLAAMINEINATRKENIVTIEHPVEYVFEEQYSMISQRAVSIDTESFNSALHSVFRQDVNVIMVGEMRDKETVATAVSAAETGHLVLSTVHTNNAAQTIDRIIDAFPPNQQDQIRTQLAGSLLGIFSQRLVPTISGELVPAYELMVNTSAVANLIREARTHELNSVIQTSAESGMISMDQVLSKLVHEGVISLENALRYSLDPEALKRML